MSETVKYRSVTIPVYPIKRGESEYWQFRRANGQQVTRSTREKAWAAALREAQTIFKGGMDIGDLTPDQIRGIKRMMEVDPELAMVDEFLLWHSRRAPKKNCGEAVTEFLALKKRNAGSSNLNYETLAKHLAMLPATENLCDITAATLPALTGSPRTRANRRAAWVTFFRWATEMGHLPHGEKTAPERLEKPIIVRCSPTTYTRKELDTILSNSRPAYRAVFALQALAGIRTEELTPQQGSRKSPLAWEDVLFDRGIIIVRPETAKTKHRRVIPICDLLRSILEPLKGEGRIGPMTHPAKPSTHGAEAETTRLGRLIGGWKRNALRHSFISFRAAQCGLAKAALEAGNSESEARRSYLDAKSVAEAEEWFSVQ
ncbi:MAG: site-specific integrase [Chthoniobacterales bacterium]